jgi:hypothetical protein
MSGGSLGRRVTAESMRLTNFAGQSPSLLGCSYCHNQGRAITGTPRQTPL